MTGTSSNVVGLVLAIVGAIASNFGVNVQKKSHSSNAERPADEQRVYWRRWSWWGGFSLVVVGAVGDFLALGFASQSLVAAVGGGTTLLANVLIGHFFNKEKLLRSDILGIAAITACVIITAAIAPPSKDYDLFTLKRLFRHPAFIIYVVLQGVVLLILLMIVTGWTVYDFFLSLCKKLGIIAKSNAKPRAAGKNSHSQDKPKDSELSEAGLSKRKVDHLPPSGNLRLPTGRERASERLMMTDPDTDGIPYYYAMFSGMFGAMSVQLGGCTAKVFLTTLSGVNQFIYFETYLFLLGMIFTMAVQTHFLNKALELGDVMSVFPVFQIFWIGFSVVGGIVFYEELESFTVVQWVLYPIALLLGGLGIYLLTAHGNIRTPVVPPSGDDEHIDAEESGQDYKLM